MTNRLDALLTLLKKNPEDTFLLYGIALEYSAIEKYDKTKEYLLKAIKTDENYVPAFMQLAQLSEKLNKIDDAKKYYTLGIEAAKKTGDKRSEREMEEFLDELD